MRIGFGKSSKRENEQLEQINIDREKLVKEVTTEEKLQAARYIGYAGLALFAGFFMTIAYSVFANSKTIAVDATVVNVSSKTTTTGSGSDRRTDTIYQHRFKFVDENGQEKTGATFGNGWPSAFDVGEVVSVGYYPDDPEKIRIRSWWGLWEIQLLLLAMGAFLIWYRRFAIAKAHEEQFEKAPD